MSDSDDTDVLLLIPPDLFLVPSSSDSDASSDRLKSDYNSGRNGVISELVEHMQSLETRISVIESKDNSLDTSLLNNSLDSQIHGNLARSRQTLPRTRFSVSQNSSLQNTPIKPRQSLSVPSTPNGYSSLSYSNINKNEMRSGYHFSKATDTNIIHTNGHDSNKHDLLPLHSDSSTVPFTSCDLRYQHAVSVNSKREPCISSSLDYSKNRSILSGKPNSQARTVPCAPNLLSTVRQNHSESKAVEEMELSEVDELLQDMEATELELSKRISSASTYQYLKDQNIMLPPNRTGNSYKIGEEENPRETSVSRKLDYQPYNSDAHYRDLSEVCEKKYVDTFPDISLPSNDSSRMDDHQKMMSEFKTWRQSVQQPASRLQERRMKESAVDSANEISGTSAGKTADRNTRESVVSRNVDDLNSLRKGAVHSAHTHNVHESADVLLHPSELNYNHRKISRAEHSLPHPLENYRNPQQNGDIHRDIESRDMPFSKCTTHASTNTDYFPRKSQRILSLSDFWEHSSNKSHEEMLKIKLEEERFRREHCEHLIQELQKRLLEQQEKVAVALRVDNEKNDLISQFHNSWSKLKQQVHVLETEHGELQVNFRESNEKHQSEVGELQSQIKRLEGELSKALDLAAGYKEKCDLMIKEKVDLLKVHADELESYKSLVQEAEKRYEQMKGEYNKLSEKNQQAEETSKNLQQELGKERLRGGEVRNEMNVIHKALDTCEAELTILRQEKENLQLKLKEETNRNSILEQKNASLLGSINDARMAEKMAKDETKSLAEEKEKIRVELQEVYQKQVDEVVKVKLQEFQTQLDAAESEFLEELKTRQQVIAECAARKIKDVMDKHQLEINLLEEKHKEENRLCELQLAQAVQKSTMLETQLNSQRATKSHLAEQLHSVMQKQWQQALQIISGGNMENLTPIQRIHAEKFFESRAPKRSESMLNCYAKLPQEPIKLASRMSEINNFRGGREEQNESSSAMTPIDDTPLTSRKESKDDLRKYIRMIAEMQQQSEESAKVREVLSSPPLLCREVPRKHYTKKELSVMSEDSVTWQPVSETSAHDTTEFMSISQKVNSKGEQQRNKPPWK